MNPGVSYQSAKIKTRGSAWLNNFAAVTGGTHSYAQTRSLTTDGVCILNRLGVAFYGQSRKGAIGRFGRQTRETHAKPLLIEFYGLA
jgi:hypothetical protein